MTRLVSLVLATALLGSVAAFAQTPPRVGKLVVTVADPSGAVLPGASVTIAGLDEATKARVFPAATASDKGVATFESLPPGRYAIEAEFQGFENGRLADVRVRPGDNKHVIVLPLQRLQDEVTVTRDRQAAGADRQGVLGTALTREQIDALSDDPDELAQQLQQIAGGNATIRVDSFEGGRLPPKAQIKAIHITRDAFAAENHSAGALFIDIITQPGMGPIRGGGNFRMRSGTMSGVNAITNEKSPENMQNYGFNFGGSLVKQRSSFSIGGSGTKSYDTPITNVATITGATQARTLSIRSPRNNYFVNGLVDYAVTRDQTIRMAFNQFSFINRNAGVGGYDEVERAYSSEETQRMFRFQEAGPLGRRFFTNTRLQLIWSDSNNRAATEALTIRINGERTRGGAQLAGGRRYRTFNLASDLDYVRGMHSVRAGVQFDGGWYRTNEASNYLGTYSFESNEAFLAGMPRSFTQRIGDPNIRYWNIQGAGYLQDDIRVRKNLTLSPGVRYEAQTHLNDLNNVAPRFGITWSPFKAGKTSLRASAGFFYEWLSTGTYEQTLRVDGFRQRELNILEPSFPDIPTGTAPPVNRYLLGEDAVMARTFRMSAGLDQAITSRWRVNATYAHSNGNDLLRGRNLNAPVAGVRPDPGFANVVEVASDAESAQHLLNVGTSLNFAPSGTPGGPMMFMMMGPGMAMPPPPPPPGGGPAGARPSAPKRFDWRRFSVNANYGLQKSRNNTDGAFALAPTTDLAAEWGPSSGDVRHRVNLFLTSTQLRNLNANLGFNTSTAPPYTVHTGFDDNGNLVFNDRPVGVGRNSARSEGQWTMNLNFNYGFQFGKTKVQLPPGFRLEGLPGGGLTATSVQNAPASRYRVGISVSIQNLTNHANYGGFSGIMTSPFFGQPTVVLGTRKVDIGMNFSF